MSKRGGRLEESEKGRVTIPKKEWCPGYGKSKRHYLKERVWRRRVK